LTESDNCVTELAAAFLQLGRSAAVTYACIAFGMSIFLESLNAARSIRLAFSVASSKSWTAKANSVSVQPTAADVVPSHRRGKSSGQ
jgi:hypothetical protein